jgi:tRNA nucleotidyltransferase (CCA-adding enzyme)
VSEAFAEDPVRILRVARFAARLGFGVAPETLALMKQMVASGEADYLVPERVWQEFAKGLMEREPERMFEVLEACSLQKKLLPELRERIGIAGGSLAVRFARLCWPLKEPEVEALCERLKVPSEVKELALLACRTRVALRASRLATPEALLELLKRADAFRRPERFEQLLQVAHRDVPIVDTARLERARAAALAVDAGAIAAQAPSAADIPRLIDERRTDAIARAL